MKDDRRFAEKSDGVGGVGIAFVVRDRASRKRRIRRRRRGRGRREEKREK